MHTHVYEVEGYGKVHVFTNGDWSGNAIVNYQDDGKKKEVEIPAKLLLEISKQGAVDFVRDRMISALENL